jgi:hypothetical protein
MGSLQMFMCFDTGTLVIPLDLLSFTRKGQVVSVWSKLDYFRSGPVLCRPNLSVTTAQSALSKPW